MALSSTADINTNPLVSAQLATLYGPQTQQALRRSQYLADALKELAASANQPIRSGGELATKLLATALLQRANDKGQDLLAKAMAGDQQAETDKYLGPLSAAVQPQAPVQAAPSPALPQPAPEPAPEPAPPPPTAGQPQAQYSPQDRDAMTRMLATEAIGEGPQGMAAAGHVALNRLRSGYGGAKSLAEVINQPHQFTGMARAGQVSPQDYATAQGVADQVLSGQVPDPTNGAMAFLNPELTHQLTGRIPAWAQQPGGQRIGRHVFFGGGQQVAQNTAAPPPGQPGPDLATVVAGADPFAPPPPQPAQVAPAQQVPAAPAPPPALPPNWPTWKPSADEVNFVHELLMDPRRHAEGVQAAIKLRQKMTEPVEGSIQLINGVPFYVSKDPAHPAVMPLGVPAQAMTQHIDNAPGAPRGAMIDMTPLGSRNVVTKPPDGYEAAQGGGLQHIPGGPADPTRVQAPPPGYQLRGPAGGLAMAPIPGSPADPHGAMNIAAAAEKLQGAIKPIIDKAVEARQDFGNVETGYRLQNGAGDVAMLKGINQLITRGAVRPNDVDQQLKADGIAGTLGELTQYLSSGGKLTPETRQKIYQAASALHAASDSQFRAQVLSHRPTTDALYGDGAFDRFVFPPEQASALGWQAPGGALPPPAPAVLKPGTREAAIAEAKRRGLLK